MMIIKQKKKINELIGNMICLDLEPFSVVEDVRFNQLLRHSEPRYNKSKRKYFSTVEIPRLYDIIKLVFLNKNLNK